MRGLLDRIRRAGQPPFHTQTAAEARAFYARSAEVLDLPRAPLARVADFTVPHSMTRRCRHACTHVRPSACR